MIDYSKNQWKISAKHSLFNLKLNEVWSYRDLLILMVRRDFVSIYKQTILGPLWFFIQPFFTMIFFTFVFGKLARISTDNLPGPLFYTAGIISWNYFSDCIIKTSAVFRDNAYIFGKVYFPRLIMPLSIVISNLLRFTVQFLLFLSIIFYYQLNGISIHPNIYALLFPVLIIVMAALGLGTGLIIAALTTKYRDLSFLLIFGIQLLMYATTVIIPLSATPKKYKWIILLNPMTPVIETFRYGFLGRGTFSWIYLIYAGAFTIFLLFAGIILFNKIEKDFIDTI